MSILGGSGHQSDPFVVHIPKIPNSISMPVEVAALAYSAGFQNKMIDELCGVGSWKLLKREYFESPSGNPGNGDLCRWIVNAHDKTISIWFDLSHVSLVVSNPSILARDSTFDVGNITSQASIKRRYLKCPKCGSTLVAESDVFGQKVQCTRCQEKFLVKEYYLP